MITFSRSIRSQVNADLRDIFDSSFDVWEYTPPELSKRSKVPLSSIYSYLSRIYPQYMGRKAKSVRYEYLIMLAKAVGMDISLMRTPQKIRKAA